MRTVLVAALSALLAPYQCSHGDQAERPIEDSAPKALHLLAERFSSQGDNSACETVISQLIEQYPSSRYAKAAREEGACNGAVAAKLRSRAQARASSPRAPEPEAPETAQEHEAPAQDAAGDEIKKGSE